MSNSVVMIEQQLQALLDRLAEVEQKEADLVKRMKNCIRSCHELLDAWRHSVAQKGFPDQRSEIYFFKQAKPQVAGRYKYYQQVLQVNLGEWKGGRNSQERRLIKEMTTIEQVFERNRFLWEYYQSGATHQDEAWFLRGRDLWLLYPGSGYFDESFCTRYDGQLADLLTAEMFSEYIGRRLSGDEDRVVTDRIVPASNAIVYTGSITQATVVGYALYEAKSFNNGHVTRNSVMEHLGNQWGVDLRNHRQTINRVSGQKEPDREIRDLLDGFNGFLNSKDF